MTSHQTQGHWGHVSGYSLAVVAAIAEGVVSGLFALGLPLVLL